MKNEYGKYENNEYRGYENTQYGGYMSRRHNSRALCRFCAVSILLLLSTVLFSSAAVPASPRAASKKVTAGRMVRGMSEKEVRRMVLRCIREGKDWDLGLAAVDYYM